MILRKALTEASKRIARRDAETLVLHLLERNRAWLLTHLDAELEPPQADELQTLVDHRAAGEPLQHLTGTQEFYGLPLRVTRDTLIPRPETEHLVEAVLEWALARGGALRVLDVGTGTGAIALALAAHLPLAAITAVDISAAALDVARSNAESLELAVRVRFLQSDLMQELQGESFDVVVSNPPYIPLTDAATLQPEVRDHEPHSALFGGVDGLAVYRRLIPAAHAALQGGGLLALEFGFGQREALADLLSQSGWSKARFVDDYAGIPRVVLVESSSSS